MADIGIGSVGYQPVSLIQAHSKSTGGVEVFSKRSQTPQVQGQAGKEDQRTQDTHHQLQSQWETDGYRFPQDKFHK